MEKTGFIEIRVNGTKGNFDLSPDNYDIQELIEMLENVEKLLYSGDRKNRPIISYSLEDSAYTNVWTT